MNFAGKVLKRCAQVEGRNFTEREQTFDWFPGGYE
jgi:hypothetical protein